MLLFFGFLAVLQVLLADTAAALPLFSGACGLAAVIVFAGAQHHRPRAIVWWRTEGVALVLFALEALARMRALSAGAPWGAIRGGVEVAAHLLVLIAALGVLVMRRPERNRDTLLDAATALLATGLLVWQLVPGSLADVDRFGVTAAVVLAVAVAAVTLRLAVRVYRQASRQVSLLLVLCAVTASLAGNVVNLLQGRPQLSAVVLVSWLSSMGLCAAAAVHPSMRRVSEREAATEPSGSLSVFLLVSSLFVGPVLLLVEGGPSASGPLPGLGLAAVTLLVSVRIGRLVGAQTALRRRLTAMLAHAADVVAITDSQGCIRYASPASAALLGCAPEALVGMRAAELVHGADRNRLAELRPDAGPARADVRLRGRDSVWIEVTVTDRRHDPWLAGYVLNVRDITERKRTERTLAHQAAHDALTGLVNTSRFAEQAEQEVARARRSGRPVALLFVDLDDFKTVNDLHGHRIGDAVLVRTADRLRTCLREGDIAGRLGGDEFAVLLADLADLEEARAVAQRIVAAMATPVEDGGAGAVVGASVGGVVDWHPDSAEDLLAAADRAMYGVKRSGKNTALVHEVGARSGPPVPEAVLVGD